MQFFLFLIAAIVLCIVLIFLVAPISSTEEEEPEFWEVTDIRLETLLQGTLDPQLEMRESYHKQILSMGSPVVSRLIHALSQELAVAQPHSDWCHRVELLLQDFGLQTIPALLQWLREKGDNPAVVRSVQKILLTYDTPALRVIMSHLEPVLLPPLVPVFCTWGASAAPLALRAFRLEPRRKLWQQLLVELHSYAVPGLIEAVRQWSGDAQQQAFFVLSRLAPPEALALFEAALQDTSTHKKMAAIRALERIQQESSWRYLVPLLEDPVEEVRALSIQVIAKLGKDSSADVLTTFSHQIQHQPTRLYEALLVAVALASLGKPVDTEMIEKGLRSKTISRQQLALQLVLHLPKEERPTYLLPLLEHSAESIVSDTVRLLLELQSPPMLERVLQRAKRLPQGHRHHRLIEDAMMCLEEWAVPLLCQTLLDSQRDQRTHALVLKSLLKMGDQRALEPVLVMIQTVSDPEIEWGVTPQDVYMFLNRLSQDHDIHHTLRRFLAEYPNSSMAPALRLFLEQNASQAQSSLSLDTQSTKI